MTARLLAPLIALALLGCKQEEGPRTLVGEGAAPPTYSLAGDTITAWQRQQQPDGLWLFRSWSITPGGTVEYLEEQERVGTPADPARVEILSEKRRGFALPPAEFEAIRRQAALLRPQALGPHDPVRGYGGELGPQGCPLDKARARVAGLNFLNEANWGAFVLQPGCDSQSGRAAAAAMEQLVDRLERAGGQAQER